MTLNLFNTGNRAKFFSYLVVKTRNSYSNLPKNLVNLGVKGIFQYEEYRFQEIDLEWEVNYLVEDLEGYVCRLVPGYAGFDLSPLDLALGNLRGLPLVAKLSDYIVRRYA